MNKNNKFNYYKKGNFKNKNEKNFFNTQTKRKRITPLKIVGIVILSITLLITIGFLLAILKAKIFDNYNFEELN